MIGMSNAEDCAWIEVTKIWGKRAGELAKMEARPRHVEVNWKKIRRRILTIRQHGSAVYVGIRVRRISYTGRRLGFTEKLRFREADGCLRTPPGIYGTGYIYGIRLTISEARTRSMHCPSIMISTRIDIVEASSLKCHSGNVVITVCHSSGSSPKVVSYPDPSAISYRARLARYI